MLCGGLSVVRERRSTWGLSLGKKSVCVFRAELNHECVEARDSHPVSSSTDLHFIF